MTIEKSKSVMKFLSVLCRIYCGIVVAGGIFAIIFWPYVLKELPNLATEETRSLFTTLSRDMASDVGCSFVSGLFTAVIMWLVSNVLTHIVRGNAPFERKQTRRMAMIAATMLASALVSPIIGGILGKFIQNGEGFGVHMEFSIQNVMLAVLLFCLTAVFDYGRRLQEQADSTV